MNQQKRKQERKRERKERVLQFKKEANNAN